MKAGVWWYVGVTMAGKTTIAAHHLMKDVTQNGRPALVIDSQGSSILEPLAPLVATVEEAVRRLWMLKRHVRFLPSSLSDVERLFSAARAGGRINVLVDEASYWMDSRSITEPIARALRTHQHSELVIRLTTQHLADIARLAVQCSSGLYAFRCTSAGVLDRLRDEFGMDPAAVETLPQGSYLTWSGGFTKK